jgi:hypothetical protein
VATGTGASCTFSCVLPSALLPPLLLLLLLPLWSPRTLDPRLREKLPLLLPTSDDVPPNDSLLLAAAWVTVCSGSPAATANVARSLPDGAPGRDAAAASCAGDAAATMLPTSESTDEAVARADRIRRKSCLALSCDSSSSSLLPPAPLAAPPNPAVGSPVGGGGKFWARGVALARRHAHVLRECSGVITLLCMCVAPLPVRGSLAGFMLPQCSQLKNTYCRCM